MATQTKVIGPIQAYAIAVQEGYTGSKSDWAEAIGNAQANAQAAEAAADRAEAAAAILPEGLTELLNDMAKPYLPDKVYKVGEYALFEGQIYRRTVAAQTAEDPFDATKWEAVNAGDELNEIRTNAYGALSFKAEVPLKYAYVPGAHLIGFASGVVGDSNIGLKATEYIDVSIYSKIKYSRCSFRYASAGGIAFYDADGAYISGVAGVQSAGSYSYVDDEADVPSSAVFVRMTALGENATGFYVNGIPKILSAGGCVSYETVQDLTDAQKSRARTNIAAADAGTMSGMQSDIEMAISGSGAIDFSRYPVVACTVSNSCTSSRDGVKYQQKQIPADNYAALTMTASAQKAAVVTFLKTAIPDDIANNVDLTGYLATGETGRHLVAISTTESFSIPADTKYLFVSYISNSEDALPSSMTVRTRTIEEIKNDIEAEHTYVEASVDTLVPYEMTAQFMRRNGTLETTSTKRLCKYKIDYSVTESVIYINGKGTFSSIPSNPYCYLWFVKSGQLMTGKCVDAVFKPTYYDMWTVTVPDGAEEIWADRCITVHARKQTLNNQERIAGIEQLLMGDSVDPMPLNHTPPTDNAYILYDTGELSDSGLYAATAYIPVSAYKKLRYTRVVLHTTGTSRVGIAFYDGNKKYISGQIVKIVSSGSGVEYETTDIDVPSGACFVRCSVRKSLTGFAAYGIGGGVSALAAAAGGQWRGKVWYAYGTSITSVEQGKYPDYLAEMSGLLLTNKGIPGQGIGNLGAISTGAVYSAICNVTDGKTDADLITLETGANDCNADVPLGTIYDTGTSTLAGCLNDCLRYLQANTNAQICVTVSPASKTVPQAANQYYEWAEMVERICHLNRVHFMYADNGMGNAKLTSANGSLYVADNIHQTNLGGYIMAQNLWFQLKNIPLFYTAIP